jgi:hypothetical protein
MGEEICEYILERRETREKKQGEREVRIYHKPHCSKCFNFQVVCLTTMSLSRLYNVYGGISNKSGAVGRTRNIPWRLSIISKI